MLTLPYICSHHHVLKAVALLLQSSIVSWCTMVREMRDYAGLQVVYDRAGLEVIDQQPGYKLNAMSNRGGNYSELLAGPDAAYDHPE